MPQDVSEINRQAIDLLTELFQFTERATTQEDEQAVADSSLSRSKSLSIYAPT
ncbi:hypothetical protein PGT21_031533 [Puccinia graminis f. sp. tritici]|uniref:Uncharacterized protein n=1 Tax=Puccinia graminis f. sp. tritici TaxID=56615 RepID=A0A5B0Q7T1_PUCGR|nr:hypothetical protein PGT21_031533 [Puccinia graminis f. sp. tritici]